MQTIVRKLEKLIPEMGDEAACIWPTVEPDSLDLAKEREIALEELLYGSDTAIDEEIRTQVKQSKGTKEVTLGDFDENDYSLSSIMYGDH